MRSSATTSIISARTSAPLLSTSSSLNALRRCFSVMRSALFSYASSHSWYLRYAAAVKRFIMKKVAMRTKGMKKKTAARLSSYTLIMTCTAVLSDNVTRFHRGAACSGVRMRVYAHPLW